MSEVRLPPGFTDVSHADLDALRQKIPPKPSRPPPPSLRTTNAAAASRFPGVEGSTVRVDVMYAGRGKGPKSDVIETAPEKIRECLNAMRSASVAVSTKGLPPPPIMRGGYIITTDTHQKFRVTYLNKMAIEMLKHLPPPPQSGASKTETQPLSKSGQEEGSKIQKRGAMRFDRNVNIDALTDSPKPQNPPVQTS